MNEGVYDMEAFKEAGYVDGAPRLWHWQRNTARCTCEAGWHACRPTPTGSPCLRPAGLMYECELEALLKERTGVEEGKELRKVGGGGERGAGDLIIGSLPGRAPLSRLGPHNLPLASTHSPPQHQVGYKKYSKVSPSAFGIDSAGKKAVAIVRTSGAITGGSGGTGSSITAGDVIGQLRGLKKNKVRA